MLFDAYLIIGSIVGLPIGMPMFAALYMKRLPKWYYFFATGMCMIVSVWSLIDGKIFDTPWTIQDRSMWVLIVFALSTVVSMPFYRRAPADYKQQVAGFFLLMKTPGQLRRRRSG